MGEFTQNLLKLTEFPFSYSIIGLLALIAGQGIDVEELSFAKVGPLFILMGFVATTLSVVDPVGALQKLIIKGPDLTGDIYDMRHRYVFGKMVNDREGNSVFTLPYLVAISNSPEDLSKVQAINWDSLDNKIDSELKKGFNIEKVNLQVGKSLNPLRLETLKTKWITTELDRNNALIYFMIVIGLFNIAIVWQPDFLSKFVSSFDSTNLAQRAVLIKFGIVTFSSLSLVFLFHRFNQRLAPISVQKDTRDTRVSTESLSDKALIVFEYLAALEAIKVKNERFRDALKDIERYLDDNHWALARYWVSRIQAEYTTLFLQEIQDKSQNLTRSNKLES